MNFNNRKPKRTKIVATIGPASYGEDTLRAMIRAGMNVARINFSHGEQDIHANAIATIRRVAKEEGVVVAILGDLQGPKIRLGKFDPIRIIPGDQLTLTLRENYNVANMELPLPHPEFVKDVNPGQRLLVDDGEIEFKVIDKNRLDLTCEVIIGGELKQRKGVSAPDSRLTLPALTDKDRSDLIFALEQKVDWIAMSFVRTADDVRELRWLINLHKGDAAIIAKIEKSEALENIDAIIEITDGIMVARGDLGVETPAAAVPIHQKRIIRSCNRVGKPVITATQMLNSMIESPRPTRAEASDVANAIFDGTDAIMLSGETASGQYPVDAVETMATIAQIAEMNLESYGNFQRTSDVGRFDGADEDHIISDAVSYATVQMAEIVGAKMIITSTMTGYTAQRVARERPKTPILCVTPNQSTYQRMALVWGVSPLMVDEYNTIDEMLHVILSATKRANLVEIGDRVVIIAGVPFGEGGQTNFVKIHSVVASDLVRLHS